MIIGILKETKVDENRVAITPEGAEIAMNHGHTVLVENDAGVGSGLENADTPPTAQRLWPAPPRFLTGPI